VVWIRRWLGHHGASIPRALWSLMGGPFEGNIERVGASDVAYDKESSAGGSGPDVFGAMRCSGV
jgi:hypothetical protein